MAEFFWSDMLIIVKEYLNDTSIITIFWFRDTAACKNQFVDVISCSLYVKFLLYLVLAGHLLVIPNH